MRAGNEVMNLSPLRKLVILCSALVALSATSGFSVDAAQRSAAPEQQEVNGTTKTDRLALPDVGSTVVRTEKADRQHRSPKSEAEFKFEPVTLKTGPAREAPSDRKVTPVAVDDAAAPLTRANDDPGAVPKPVASTEETYKNYTEEPEEEKNPDTWSGWSYSKGLMERTDRRARYLWNKLIEQYGDGLRR